jgi:ribosomal protein S18 acetylase RimI-like enzyme
MLRCAAPPDLDRLVTLEHRCFAGDRLSRRSFRHLLSRGNAVTLVDEQDGRLRGYALVLYHRAHRLARLYSLAVAPDCRRQGVASRLLAAVEQAARAQERVKLRLEVRQDNLVSLAFYRQRGYRQFGRHRGYYEDRMDALRLEKELIPRCAI